MPGERLCAPCKSALKRARDTTVSEAILPLRRTRRRPGRDGATPLEAGGSVVPSSSTRGSWARLAAVGLVAAVVVVAAGTWLAHSRSADGTIAPRYSVGPPESNAETIKAAASTGARPSPLPAAQAPSTSGAVAAAARVPIDPLAMPANIAVPRPPAAVPAEPAPLVSSAPPARGNATDPALGAFPAEIRAPAPVVVAQAPAPKPVQDRWHRLADALNRCPADDVIARTVCQESLRIDQCEGYWGRVAPCPARQDREYGN
jgi:hypothetical protein